MMKELVLSQIQKALKRKGLAMRWLLSEVFEEDRITVNGKGWEVCDKCFRKRMAQFSFSGPWSSLSLMLARPWRPFDHMKELPKNPRSTSPLVSRQPFRPPLKEEET
jgi:hypothetical protein